MLTMIIIAGNDYNKIYTYNIFKARHNTKLTTTQFTVNKDLNGAGDTRRRLLRQRKLHCVYSSGFRLGFLGFLERLFALHNGQMGALRWICWWQDRHACVHKIMWLIKFSLHYVQWNATVNTVSSVLNTVHNFPSSCRIIFHSFISMTHDLIKLISVGVISVTVLSCVWHLLSHNIYCNSWNYVRTKLIPRPGLMAGDVADSYK